MSKSKSKDGDAPVHSAKASTQTRAEGARDKDQQTKLVSGAPDDAEIFVMRDGHGSDMLTAFRPAKDRIEFDMVEISRYRDVQDRMTEVDNGDGTFDTVITYDNGDTLTLAGVRNASFGPSNFAYSAGPVCLHEGTPILTERGEVAIEYLRPDDIVWTKDNGWQAIRFVTFETMVFKTRDDAAKPILIPKNALGMGRPSVDLITSPQHRILLTLPKTGKEVLVPAVKLIGQNGIRRMRGRKKAQYLNIVMERHSVIQAAGCWVESLLVTSRSLERQGKAVRRLMRRYASMEPARRIVQSRTRPRRLRSA